MNDVDILFGFILDAGRILRDWSENQELLRENVELL